MAITYLLRNIPNDLWKRVKWQAAKDGHSLRFVILRLLEQYAKRTIVLSALLSACSSPTAPTGAAPSCSDSSGYINLRVHIVGHISNRPLSGVPAQLAGFTCEQTTRADGIASWMVMPGQRVTVVVRGATVFIPESEVMTDVQWLLSLPE